MRQLLTQNSKMKKSSTNGTTVLNWTLPAFRAENGFTTCPMARDCISGCYARSGTYRFKSSVIAHNRQLEVALSDEFRVIMITEIKQWLNKRSVSTLKIRIHDAGDFFSLDYLAAWHDIMQYFEDNNRVTFYAYTKMISLFKRFNDNLGLDNFTVIYSFGGKEDSLIDVNRDRHANVFETSEELKEAGYVNGTQDDMVAAMGPSNKIGLVYHGVKNFNNTNWKAA